MGFDVLILGGGFAGLSCGAALADKGLRVRIVEKKPHLGGRAYSFKDPATGEAVDNGQHLFMGCYRETRRFLKRVGAAGLLEFPKKIRVDYADAGGKKTALRCPSWTGSPLHLALGVAALGGLTLADKWGLWRLDSYMRKINGAFPEELDRMTVAQWLGSLGQSRRIQERLFNPIALGALNDDPRVASALGFAQVLKGIFYDGVDATRLGLAKVGLSELYVPAARAFIESRGGEVLLSQKCSALIDERGGVRGAVLESGERLEAEIVVSTLPPWDLGRLGLPIELDRAWASLKPAPIVSLCLWLEESVLDEPFVGLIGTSVQWAFNKSRILGREGRGQYLSLVISGAHEHVSWEPKALLELAKRDLGSCFPRFQKATIRSWKVVKEPYATLSPVPGAEGLRPKPGQALPGFFLAGDWTRTGFPATIESAVASGHRVAEMILGEKHAEIG